MEYQIPKLTLQPLIENAVLHGILKKDDKTGTIVLTGWIEGTSIVLLISDDGVGIPSEKLSAEHRPAHDRSHTKCKIET